MNATAHDALSDIFTTHMIRADPSEPNPIFENVTIEDRPPHSRECAEARVVVGKQTATVRLSDGTRLIDFASGGFGYGDDAIARAVANQVSIGPLSTRHFLSLPLAALVRRLAELSPGNLEVSYVCNSRNEAIEGALKMARGFHRSRREFIAVSGAYHGSTLGALSVTGIEHLRAPFPDFPLAARFADSDREAAALVSKQTAAVVVKPYPDGVGDDDAAWEWLVELRRRCANVGALMIVDETMTGLGRTGRNFAVEHANVVPDILVIGEALGGDVFPAAAYAVSSRINQKVYGHRDPTLHASATAGNPAACAAALATLSSMVERDLPRVCAERGSRLLRRLQRISARFKPVVNRVDGAGLLVRVWVSSEGAASRIEQAARRFGLLIGSGRSGDDSFLEFVPPLDVSDDEIGSALWLFERSLGTATESSSR